MNHRYYLGALMFLLIASTALAQTWSQKTTAPFPGNEGGGSFTIGTNIYVASGEDRSFYLYDPVADAWTKKADLPGDNKKRTYQIAFAINGKGYVGLGLSEAGTMPNDFWQYDPTSDTWTKKAEFPGGGRIQAGCFVIGSKGYVGGGADLTGGYFNDFYEYDPASDVWTKKAKIQASGYANVGSPAAFSLGGYGYFVGGERGTIQNHNTAQYDPIADKWTKKAPLPGDNRAGGTGFSYGHLGYVCFGQIGFTTGYDDFFSYDPATDTWQALTEFPTKAPRAYAVATVVGNNVYLGMGWDIGAKTLNDWWQLALPIQAAVPHVSLSVNQIDFGQLSSTSSKDTSISIHAGVDTALMITSLKISGPGSAAFSIKNPPAVPYTISPGKDLSITVSYKPTDTGMFDATLTILSNAELETAHPTTIALHGAAISLTPHIILSSGAIDFGKPQVAASVDSTVTITAGSNADLTVTAIDLTNASGVFTLKNLPTIPFSIAAGKKRTFGISFKPIDAKVYDGTLVITSNAEGETAHKSPVTLHGEGMAASAVSPKDQTPIGLEVTAVPNPFIQGITVSVTVSGNSPERVRITIVDIHGTVVMDRSEAIFEPGNHTITFDTQTLSSGTYWIVAQTAQGILSTPIVKAR